MTVRFFRQIRARDDPRFAVCSQGWMAVEGEPTISKQGAKKNRAIHRRPRRAAPLATAGHPTGQRNNLGMSTGRVWLLSAAVVRGRGRAFLEGFVGGDHGRDQAMAHDV